MEIDGFFRVQRIPPNHLSGKNLESTFKYQLSLSFEKSVLKSFQKYTSHISHAIKLAILVTKNKFS